MNEHIKQQPSDNSLQPTERQFVIAAIEGMEAAAKIADDEADYLAKLPRYGCPGASLEYKARGETARKIARQIRAALAAMHQRPIHADVTDIVGLAIEEAWNASNSLPPIQLSPDERDGLARAALAQFDTLPKGRDAKLGSVRSKGSAVAEPCAQGPKS